MLAENTLLKTAYHFLLLLVGFDTLTYHKDYDISPILVGHQSSPSSTRKFLQYMSVLVSECGPQDTRGSHPMLITKYPVGRRKGRWGPCMW